MKKHIIIFSGYYLPFLGGIERYTNKLSDELVNQNCDVTIVCSNHDSLKSYEIINNIKVYRIPLFNLFKSRYPIYKKNSEFKNLWNKIINTKYDCIVCNTRFQLTTVLGIKLSKLQNIPILVLDHGSSHFTVNNKILDFFGEIYEHLLTKYVKQHIKNFYGVSYRCVEWLKHFKINGRGVIYNSIEGSNYEKYKNKHYINRSKDDIVITYAGRLIREKGLFLLCDAYESLFKKYKNIKLYVAGDGPIFDELKKQYGDKVNFVGKLDFDNVMALYNDSDIFVYPSMYPEGLPTSILEAGLMKTAIIATDRGGTVEVINQDDLGLIMNENTESLVKNLEFLINNPKEIIKYKNNIHKRVLDNFTWDVTAKKILEEVERLKNEQKNN